MAQTTLSLDNVQIAPVIPVFARHETFHPRFGWLKKGFDAARVNPGIFLQEDATVRLGVGKNMVSSMRYWCSAFKLLDENDSPTEFGEQLLGEKGWDSFLEDPASLWLLHWNLLKPTCEAAAWYYTFNVFRASEFSREDLFEGLKSYLKILEKNLAESSLTKDLTCILRMYVEPDAQKNTPIEDSIDCPFTELGLIRKIGSSKNYQFRIGTKTTLPAAMVVATCLEYASWVNQGTKTIALSRLLYDPGSPGMVFKLTESALCEAIETVAKRLSSIALSDTAGLIQLSFNEEPASLAQEILDEYYGVTRSKF